MKYINNLKKEISSLYQEQKEQVKSHETLQEAIKEQTKYINNLKEEISSHNQNQQEITTFQDQTSNEFQKVTKSIKELKETIQSIQQNQSKNEQENESMLSFKTQISSLQNDFNKQQNQRNLFPNDENSD